MAHGNRGIILLEALVALAILGSAAVALVTLSAAAVRLESRDRGDERELESADRVLAASTLLTRAELDQRIGRHTIGEFGVTVQRPERGLYRISVGPVGFPDAEHLVTVVFRPDDGGGP